jgi:Fe-S oxidoreductase
VALRHALEGGGLLNGLADPGLREVMDLCISCKACKHECPTGVDVARLKTEWLAYLNQTQGVPRSARFQVAAPRLAQRASLAPGMMNFLLRHPLVRAMLEGRYGLDRRIPPPRLADQTFRKWWKRHRMQGGERGPVAYFVDTWTNFYWPEVGIAAVRLLEAAGYEVIVPNTVCCGRPAISKGMLNEARRLADRNIQTLSEFAEHDIPILGSEPSCILTFTDEAPQLVRTEDALRVAKVTKTVEQFLAELIGADPAAIPFSKSGEDAAGARTAQVRPPPRLLYHAHCHQKALVGTAAVRTLLGTGKLRTTEINSGCCGMAGGFGHEKEHYEVARAIGEQRLFPAVRSRGDAEIIVSGFSCREQIEHHCKVRPRHVLEVLADALDQNPPR